MPGTKIKEGQVKQRFVLFSLFRYNGNVNQDSKNQRWPLTVDNKNLKQTSLRVERLFQN